MWICYSQDMAWPISIMEDLNGASKGMRNDNDTSCECGAATPGHGMAHQHHGRLKRGLQRNDNDTSCECGAATPGHGMAHQHHGRPCGCK
ncbi:hypothetical protein M8J75_008953 [Diaphorina citri]|nr:hypothetical protein M8J75_008953 [Diaphorina citri]